MIEGLIFDMDGLMIDTEKLLHKYWCQAANELGYPMKVEHVLQIRSLAAKYAIPKLKGMLGEDFDYYKVRARRMELMKQHILEHGLEEKKGLLEILEYGKQRGLKMAVATATDLERTTMYLKSIGKFDYFDAIVCGSMIENGKPEPDIYLEAAKRLDLNPSVCVALEDSPNGILSAYRAGCKPVMVPDMDEPDEDTLKRVFAVKSDLTQVVVFLEEINK
ncbi:MAG: HAD family phosphatase [Lachnospiraceae bacterium]|nr:HAD family phosphatase [Lachnospiraceae bacterium]